MAEPTHTRCSSFRREHPTKRAVWRTFACLACITLSTTLFTSTAIARVQNPAAQDWQVRYEAGTATAIKLDKGTKMHLTVTAEGQILFDPKERAGIVIQTADVVEVTYDNVAKSRADLWDLASVLTPLPVTGSYWAAGAIVDAMFIGGSWAVLRTLKGKDHFINLVWRTDEGLAEIVFEAPKKDYQQILTGLQQTTGRQWKNLPEQREQVRREIEKERENAIPVRLDRRVIVGSALLKPGKYAVLFLQRADSGGVLYFFAGSKVDVKKISLGVPVETSPPAQGNSIPEVVYETSSPTDRLCEIRTSKKTYRLCPSVYWP